MISHERRCIFIHIPKCAGSSIEDAIWGPDRSGRSPEDLWMGAIAPYRNKYQTGGLQHLLAHQVRTEVGDEVFGSYFRFAVVRNPWDRAVSQYLYLKRHRELQTFYGLGRWVSFSGYLRRLKEVGPIFHCQSTEQWRFLLDDHDSMLVDELVRFEAIGEGYDKVASRLGVTAALPHARKSPNRKPYGAYYNAWSRETVGKLYAKDVELFGYEF